MLTTFPAIAALNSQTLDTRLSDAETRLPSDVRATNVLIDEVAIADIILTQEQSRRIELLRIYSDITCGNLDRAHSQLFKIEQQPHSVEVFSRVLYFKAMIALKRFEFENVFILLNRMDQLPNDKVDINHQFDIYILAANVHAQAHAYNDAKGFATKALVLAHKINTPTRVCRALNSMAFILQKNDDNSRIKALAEEVIEHCGAVQDISELALAYRFLANWHNTQHQFEQEWLNKAIVDFGTLQSPMERAVTQLELAKSLIQTNQLLAADEALSSALHVIENGSDINAKTSAFRIKAQLLEQMGLLDDAMF